MCVDFAHTCAVRIHHCTVFFLRQVDSSLLFKVLLVAQLMSQLPDIVTMLHQSAFSLVYSECLYDGVYVNEALVIDQHLVQLHSSSQDIHTQRHKSPQFFLNMHESPQGCMPISFSLLCLAAFVLYIFVRLCSVFCTAGRRKKRGGGQRAQRC